MILAAMMLMTLTAKAISYGDAKSEALFLSDKMVYELDLTDEQYEAVYEINLDYLLCVNNPDDLFGICWERRNADRIANKPASAEHQHAPAPHPSATPGNINHPAIPNNPRPSTPNRPAGGMGPGGGMRPMGGRR